MWMYAEARYIGSVDSVFSGAFFMVLSAINSILGLGTMIDPGRLSEALRILGQRDITVTAAENSPIALTNPAGETILIAPMISYPQTEPQLPSLEEVNMTREEEKQHKAPRRRLAMRLTEFMKRGIPSSKLIGGPS